MKLKNSLFILTLGTMMFFSCTGADTLPKPGPGPDDRVAVSFSTSVNNANTKAVDNAWSEDDRIGVYMFETGTNTVSNTAANRMYYYNGDNKFASNPTYEIFFPSDVLNKVDFLAYYPFNTAVTDEYAYVLDLASQADQEKIDLMVSDRVVDKDKTTPQVSLDFRHKLAKIYFEIKAPVLILENPEFLDELAIEIVGMHTKANYILTNLEVEEPDEIANIPMLVTINGGGTEINAIAEAVVLPDTQTTGRSFNFRLSPEKEVSWPIDDEVVFTAGKKYTYRVSIEREEISMTSSVSDWEEGKNGGGEIPAQ
ncbi:fimbrillin family protein [Parabacteroides sp. PF5-9]|uniref:fimbrillin family protein n=1 Tax=Parabacteroides sp. PF5-9 TaxID=1742404 RepID=UPI0024734E0E|nr:fimbrillin family protein [Parabacteroides sp. PF5-9]MDH6359216.1 hypothetical protein [Parabacteroides sp. PF5-9]